MRVPINALETPPETKRCPGVTYLRSYAVLLYLVCLSKHQQIITATTVTTNPKNIKLATYFKLEDYVVHLSLSITAPYWFKALGLEKIKVFVSSA